MDPTSWLVREIDQINLWLQFIMAHLFGLDALIIGGLITLGVRRINGNGKKRNAR